MNYSQNGSWIALAGIVVAALSHFGIVISQDNIITVVAGAVTLYGIIHQFITHRNLAVAAGAIKPTV